MTVTDAMARRRSIRAFRPDAVDPAVLRRVLATAQRAPSGGNLQPWQAVAVTGAPWDAVKGAVAARVAMGEEGRQDEYAIYPPALPEPWRSRRHAMGEAMYGAIGVPRADAIGRMVQFAANFTGFGAPVMLFIHCNRIMGPPQWADMGIWLQSVMLLLTEAGLDCCPQEAWSVYGPTVRAGLGVGDEQILYCGLAIGHGDHDNPVNQWPVPRAPVDDAIVWQGFDA